MVSLTRINFISQQWYGANHGANRFADSRRNLGPEKNQQVWKKVKFEILTSY